MNESDFLKLVREKGLAIASSTRAGPKLERTTRNAPLVPNQVKAQDSTEHIVRITSYRRRLLDDDNLAEKYHVDALRYACLIHSDARKTCRIITDQIKVKTKSEEHTLIELLN